jgi:hypothetical protein
VNLSPSSHPPERFAEKYCRHFALPPEAYEADALRRAFYPQGRLAHFLGFRDSFAADRTFIAGVGRLTRRRDLAGEAVEFHQEPSNREFWRRYGRFRVSVQRTQALMDAVWD